MSDYVSFATYKSTRGHPFALFVNRMPIVVFMVTLCLTVLLIFGMHCHHVTLVPKLCHILNLN